MKYLFSIFSDNTNNNLFNFEKSKIFYIHSFFFKKKVFQKLVNKKLVFFKFENRLIVPIKDFSNV